MAQVKFYGLSELLEAIISKCQVSEDDWKKACQLWSQLSTIVGFKLVLNFEEEWEAFSTIKSYKKIGFDHL